MQSWGPVIGPWSQAQVQPTAGLDVFPTSSPPTRTHIANSKTDLGKGQEMTVFKSQMPINPLEKTLHPQSRKVHHPRRKELPSHPALAISSTCALLCPGLAPRAVTDCHCGPRGQSLQTGTRQATCHRRWSGHRRRACRRWLERRGHRVGRGQGGGPELEGRPGPDSHPLKP